MVVATEVSRSSRKLFERAKRVFPGGTTRTTIMFRDHPIYLNRGDGARVFDEDGHSYIDFANNFTTLIHGHCFGPVTEAAIAQLNLGSCFANPTSSEIDLAELIVSRVPSIDQIRFVNTGTEAVMFAIKAARAFTGRHKIAKFEGAYHGAYDWAEVSETTTPDGNNLNPPARANYIGMPPSVTSEVVVLPFNDLERTRSILSEQECSLAAIVVDTMPSRPGLIPLKSEYVELLNEYAQKNDTLIISDEVLNFRLGYHGAAQRFGLRADLTTLGKVIGGGMPIGAIGGREEIVWVFDSSRGSVVPQGGTFAANPVSMVAGHASLIALDRPAFERLEVLGDYARRSVERLSRDLGCTLSATGLGSLIRLHPKARPPSTYAQYFQSPAEKQFMQDLHFALLERGILISNTGLIALSTPMNESHIDALTAKLEDAIVSEGLFR
ncbi:aspartate aminotransferase family protein [Hoeflea poritis]|uniref:Aspartate aminotransferase family protein n=1 Tax=Hoeflea poritis TaxID=2993659 RepID=A0ABT4VT16_9HYPH|nr:aspartate aminotransferase family protein [Hoeflea poritis]MDA4847829.1 aspartate aminotransferase family protein [Hoeflea poritis]